MQNFVIHYCDSLPNLVCQEISNYVRIFLHILLFVDLVYNWFVPHAHLHLFPPSDVLVLCFFTTFTFIPFVFFLNSASYVIFNKTFTPYKSLGCHCIHNQRTISLLCFTSIQAQMGGQH